MAIGGINSYFGYQYSMNNFRLSQALSNNNKFIEAISATPRTSSYDGIRTSYNRPSFNNTNNSLNNLSFNREQIQSNLKFIKNYNTNMSDLMKSANSLKASNYSGAMNDLTVKSSNAEVASANENLPARMQRSLSLNVKQLASAQTNLSSGVNGKANASGDMDFSITGRMGFAQIRVNAKDQDGNTKTNAQVLQEAANKINSSRAGVKASVLNKDDGTSVLELKGSSTGKINSFTVSGTLGAAAGADKVESASQNAKYSVTDRGYTYDKESSTNDVTVDGARIGVTLKGTGETKIGTEMNTEAISNAVGDLVNSYNASIKFLNDNYEKGSGVDKQLRSLVEGLGNEDSMKKLGITVNKDATLNYDKAVLEKSLKDDPANTKSLISGANGIATNAYDKAISGLRTTSQSLMDGKTASEAESDANSSFSSGFDLSSMNNPFGALQMYSKYGVSRISNYYAVGSMLNLLV